MRKYREIIRALREDKDLKQIEIAKILNITQQQYSRYEIGETEMPISILVSLANYYGVSTDYITGRTNSLQGIDGLNKNILKDYTIGCLISDILSLNKDSQFSVIEYIELQKLKNKK